LRGAPANATVSDFNVSDVTPTTLIIAPEIGRTNGFFKVRTITGTIAPTPEADTLGMLGLALIGIGLIARKRKINLA
jgi:hypothetical protein